MRNLSLNKLKEDTNKLINNKVYFMEPAIMLNRQLNQHLL